MPDSPLTLARKTRSTVTWAVVLSAVAVGGCRDRRYQGWRMSFAPQEGHAAVDADGVTLLFEGVPMSRPADQTGGGAACSLQIAGGSPSRIAISAFGKTATNTYRDGVNTVDVDRYSVQILNAGRTAKVGDKRFDLAGGKRTIVIAQDGTASVRAPSAPAK